MMNGSEVPSFQYDGAPPGPLLPPPVERKFVKRAIAAFVIGFCSAPVMLIGVLAAVGTHFVFDFTINLVHIPAVTCMITSGLLGIGMNLTAIAVAVFSLLKIRSDPLRFRGKVLAIIAIVINSIMFLIHTGITVGMTVMLGLALL